MTRKDRAPRVRSVQPGRRQTEREHWTVNAIEGDTDPAGALALAAAELSAGRPEAAAALVERHYPRHPCPRRHDSRARASERAGPSAPRPPTTPTRRLALFRRDGFVDRYIGRRLVCPSALCALADALPGAFPMREGHADSHRGHWDLFPTLDHVTARAAGAMHAEASWVTTSVTTRLEKGTRALEALGWRLLEPSADPSWDGLLGRYRDYAATRPRLAALPGNRGWHDAALEATPSPNAGRAA